MEESVEQHFQKDQTRQEKNLVIDKIIKEDKDHIGICNFIHLVKQTRSLLIFSYVN